MSSVETESDEHLPEQEGFRWLRVGGYRGGEDWSATPVEGPYGSKHWVAAKFGYYRVPHYLLFEWANLHISDDWTRCMIEFGRTSEAHGGFRGEAFMPLKEAIGILRQHGGRRVERRPLPRPDRPILEALAEHESPDMSAWVARMASWFAGQPCPDGRNRHGELTRLNAETKVYVDGDVPRMASFAAVATRVLEGLEERCISSLPQAIAYALSLHAEWRREALAWLEPHRLTWLRDYQRQHPEVVFAAERASAFIPDVPQWLTRSRLAPVPNLPPEPTDYAELSGEGAPRDWAFPHLVEPEQAASQRSEGERTARFTTPSYGGIYPTTLVEGTDISDAASFMEAFGIRDQEARSRCTAELLEATSQANPQTTGGLVHLPLGRIIEVSLRHGGRLPPRIALARPEAPVWKAPPPESARSEWILHKTGFFALKHEPDRTGRHGSLIRHVARDEHATPGGTGSRERVFALSLALDAWAEEEIATLTQAVAYAMSMVPEWRRAGIEWLYPVRSTWFRAYARQDASFRRLVGHVRPIVTDLPWWFVDAGTSDAPLEAGDWHRTLH